MVRYRSTGGLPIRAHNVDQEVLSEDYLPIIIEAVRRGNSVKPDEAYEALEQLYGNVRRLNLFSGLCRRAGWTRWDMGLTGPQGLDDEVEETTS